MRLRDKIEKLSDELLSGEAHLSFSSFNQFLRSPAHFIEYKFGEKVQSDAFRTGLLVDTLLLEPQLFDTRYKVFDRNEVLPFPDSTMAKKENKAAMKAFIDSLPDNVQQISLTEYEEAELMVESIKKIRKAKGLLEMCDEFQGKAISNYGGFKWYGFKDASCEELTIDLKTTQDASSRGFKRSIMKFGYHRQAFLYNQADGNPHKSYFIIAVEKKKPYACGVHHITKQLLEKAQKEIDKGLQDLRMCILDNDLFFQSYEFHARKTHGVFEVGLNWY